MDETGRSPLQEPRKGSLAEAIREVRNIAADRADVIADIREASRTRLELLAHELAPVFADVPPDDPTFDFVISNGEEPRLWIDAVAHVALGRDRRTYRFVRDTRMGRVVLVESADLKTVADRVTLYIAERVVERRRMIDGDVESIVPGRSASLDATDRHTTLNNVWKGVLSLLLGAVVGAALVLAFLYWPLVEGFIRNHFG